MPSTFSTNLGLELMATGEQPGTWGSITNENFQMIDQATNGYAKIIVGGAAFTITVVDGAVEGDGRKKVLHFTGLLDRICTITFAPKDMQAHYIVINDTGIVGARPPEWPPEVTGYALRFTQGAGATYELACGYANIIACDGAGDTAGVIATLNNMQLNNLKVAGTLTSGPLSVGGALTVTGSLTTTGLTVNGASQLNGTLAVTTNITVGVDLSVARNFGCAGTSALNVVSANSVTTGTLGATGTASFSGNVDCTAGLIQHVPGHRIAFVSRVECLGNLNVNIGGDAAYDMYCRNVDGNFARIPIGAVGTYMRVHPNGVPYWAGMDAVSIPIGTPIPGGTHSCALFVWGSVLSQSAGFIFDAGQQFLGVGTTPSHPLHLFHGGEARCVLDGPNGTRRTLQFRTSNAVRWSINTTADGESTGNAGSHFQINRYLDNGTEISPFLIFRHNAHIMMGSPIDCGAAVNLVSNAHTEVALAIRGHGGQEAALISFQNYLGTQLSYIDKNGKYVGTIEGNSIYMTRTPTVAQPTPILKEIGQLIFVAPAQSTAIGGQLAFRYGTGNSWMTVYLNLPASGGSGSGLTWSWNTSTTSFLSAATEGTVDAEPIETEQDDLGGMLQRILQRQDLVNRLRDALGL